MALLFLFSGLMVILFGRAKICAILIDGIKGEYFCKINFVVGPVVQEVLFILFYFLALVRWPFSSAEQNNPSNFVRGHYAFA